MHEPTIGQCSVELAGRRRLRSRLSSFTSFSAIRHSDRSAFGPTTGVHGQPALASKLCVRRYQISYNDMGVMAKKALVLAIALSALSIADVRGQSGGHDLPRGFRSLAGVTLNRDSAATIRAKLGDTRERRIDIGRDVYAGWCYVLADGSSRALLELMSDASGRGTPGRALNVIRLRANAPPADREGCARLHAGAELSTPAGLRLGLGSRKIEDLLGRPTRRGADSLIYYFDSKEYLRRDSPGYDAWNTLEYRESCFDAGPPYANVEAAVIVLLRDGEAAELRIERYDQSVC